MVGKLPTRLLAGATDADGRLKCKSKTFSGIKKQNNAPAPSHEATQGLDVRKLPLLSREKSVFS
jgi:hypothetical protein